MWSHCCKPSICHVFLGKFFQWCGFCAAGSRVLIRCCWVLWRHKTPGYLWQEKMHFIKRMEKVWHFHVGLQQSWQILLWKITDFPILSIPLLFHSGWLYSATLNPLYFHTYFLLPSNKEQTEAQVITRCWIKTDAMDLGSTSLAHQ